jgi:hypothetical protein
MVYVSLNNHIVVIELLHLISFVSLKSLNLFILPVQSQYDLLGNLVVFVALYQLFKPLYLNVFQTLY